MLAGCGDGGVEALEMADLYDATLLGGKFEDAVCRSTPAARSGAAAEA
jgi:hypothetical protein